MTRLFMARRTVLAAAAAAAVLAGIGLGRTVWSADAPTSSVGPVAAGAQACGVVGTAPGGPASSPTWPDGESSADSSDLPSSDRYLEVRATLLEGPARLDMIETIDRQAGFSVVEVTMGGSSSSFVYVLAGDEAYLDAGDSWVSWPRDDVPPTLRGGAAGFLDLEVGDALGPDRIIKIYDEGGGDRRERVIIFELSFPAEVVTRPVSELGHVNLPPELTGGNMA